MPASTRRAAIIQRLPAFCAPLKKKRRWAPGRLLAEPRGSRFSGARATAALELLRLAATIGGTALRRSPANYFLQPIHIGVSASSDTGSKFFTTSYRSI